MSEEEAGNENTIGAQHSLPTKVCSFFLTYGERERDLYSQTYVLIVPMMDLYPPPPYVRWCLTAAMRRYLSVFRRVRLKLAIS